MAIDDDLLKWMDALIDYAKDWDQTFPKKEYFTQEFWYLLVECYRANETGRPLTIGDAQGKMKSGASNARRDRIQNAIDDGFLETRSHPDDGRSMLLVPTVGLTDLLEQHLRRTRKKAIAALGIEDSAQKGT